MCHRPLQMTERTYSAEGCPAVTDTKVASGLEAPTLDPSIYRTGLLSRESTGTLVKITEC